MQIMTEILRALTHIHTHFQGVSLVFDRQVDVFILALETRESSRASKSWRMCVNGYISQVSHFSKVFLQPTVKLQNKLFSSENVINSS